jgi:hypothetical protein
MPLLAIGLIEKERGEYLRERERGVGKKWKYDEQGGGGHYKKKKKKKGTY